MIDKDTLIKFDKWLLNNPDVTQDDREVIMEFVGDYIKEVGVCDNGICDNDSEQVGTHCVSCGEESVIKELV